jgi:hypothetical protein
MPNWHRATAGPTIYDDERDRKLWLETLGEAWAKTGWRIHAWVMMNNHYHLLLDTCEFLWLVAGDSKLSPVTALEVSVQEAAGKTGRECKVSQFHYR